MNTKPEAYVRSWQWNNAWYISQERPVTKIGMKEALSERNIACFQPEDLMSSIYEKRHLTPVEIVETMKNKVPKDENHPLWQNKPAYTYKDRTWLPKNNQLKFAAAITNTAVVNRMPDRYNQYLSDFTFPVESKYRLETLIKNAYIGDAEQALLPRNFSVPYIGWHPVESKMRPRNLYDHTKYSWGRSMPREYGVKNERKLKILSRSLFMESVKISGNGTRLLPSVEKEAHRQFIERPDGKLVRFDISIPISLYGRKPLPPNVVGMDIDTLDSEPVPCVEPMDPVATLHATNVYRNTPAHPITSTQHSHPYAHTVFCHYTTHIAPQWRPEAEHAKSLMVGFCTALGQARLRFDEKVSGDLPEPVTINIINTDGQRYQVATFQLNSMDLDSVNNVFWMHPEPMELFEFCGYDEGQVKLNGLNLDTYSQIHTLMMNGMEA